MGIFQELLLKAKRDLTKLVQVQRMVTKNGKTFPQTFYVDPTQVKSTDRVIGGQQNLLPSVQALKKPATGVYDQTYFNALFNQDKKKALEYLKECGVVWTDSTNFGITVMRAKMAMNKKFGISSPKPQNTTPKQTTQQVTQNAGVQIVLTPDQQKELDSYSTGREKVVVLKKLLGQDGCLQYAKQLGVTWTESAHRGINLMQMSMALTKYFDSSSGNISTAQTAVVPKPTPASSKPKVDKSQIDVSKLTDERQKKIAEILNKCEDVNALKAFAKVGIVGEDEQASEYIQNTLCKAYYNKNWRPRTINDPKEKKNPYYDSVFKLFSDSIGKDASDLIADGVLNNPMSSLNMLAILMPEVSFRVGGSILTFGDSKINRMPYEFKQFSLMNTYSKESFLNGKLNLKETGLYNILQHIAKNNPDLKSETDRMVSEFEQALECVKGNELFFNALLNKDLFPIKRLFDRVRPEFIDPENIFSSIRVSVNETTLSNFEQDLEKVLAFNGVTVDEFIDNIVNYNNGQGYYVSCLDKTPKGNLWKSPDTADTSTTLYHALNLRDSKNNWGFDSDSKPYSLLSTKKFLFSYIAKKRLGKSLDDLYELDESNLKDSDIEKKIIQNLNSGVYYSIVPFSEQIKEDKNISKLQKEFSTLKKEDILSAYKHILKAFNKNLYDADIHQNLTDSLDFDTLVDRLTNWKSKVLVDVSTSDPKTNAVVANLSYSASIIGMLHNTLNLLKWNNRRKSPVRAEFSFNHLHTNGSITSMQQLSLDSSSELVVNSELGGQEKASKYNKVILDQIDKLPTISTASFEELRKTFLGDDFEFKDAFASPNVANDRILKSNSNPELNSFGDLDNETKKLLRDVIQTASSYTVKLVEKKGSTLSDAVDEALQYYPNGKPNVAQKPRASDKRLLALREEALKTNNCSIKSIVDDELQALDHETKMNWRKNTEEFKERSLKVYGAYHINNSTFSKSFEDECANMKENLRNSARANCFYDNKIKRFYHGTNPKGGAGICGVTGKFLLKGHGNKTAGSMLGDGVYLAEAAAKSAGYLNTKGWGMGHGCLLICDAMLGNHHTCDDYHSVDSDYSVDSVSMIAGGDMNGRKLRADEWCVRKPELVCPRILIDAESYRRW